MYAGQRIKFLREDRDVLQQDLANATNINVSVLNRIEKGTRPIRDTELLCFADYFHVTTDYLLGREGGGGQEGEGLSDDARAIASAYDIADTYAQGIVKSALRPYLKGQESPISTTTDTAARIGKKILAASPTAQAAVSEIIEQDAS